MRGQLKLKQGSKLNGIVAEEAPCAIWKKHQVKKKKKNPNKGICKGVCLYIYHCKFFLSRVGRLSFHWSSLTTLGVRHARGWGHRPHINQVGLCSTSTLAHSFVFFGFLNDKILQKKASKKEKKSNCYKKLTGETKKDRNNRINWKKQIKIVKSQCKKKLVKQFKKRFSLGMTSDPGSFWDWLSPAALPAHFCLMDSAIQMIAEVNWTMQQEKRWIKAPQQQAQLAERHFNARFRQKRQINNRMMISSRHTSSPTKVLKGKADIKDFSQSGVLWSAAGEVEVTVTLASSVPGVVVLAVVRVVWMVVEVWNFSLHSLITFQASDSVPPFSRTSWP